MNQLIIAISDLRVNRPLARQGCFPSGHYVMKLFIDVNLRIIQIVCPLQVI